MRTGKYTGRKQKKNSLLAELLRELGEVLAAGEARILGVLELQPLEGFRSIVRSRLRVRIKTMSEKS